VRFNERFVHGRLRRRVLRAPAVDGWLAEELAQRPPERTEAALKKIEGDCLALPIPGSGDLARLSAAATVAAGGPGASFDDVELLIGWPEHLVIVRRRGVVVHAEGDVVHFGRLALDGRHAIERTGYQYIADTGIEVRVELALHTEGAAGTTLLEPGGRARHGPYEILHEHSFDPSDRPSGARTHGYTFVVRRDPPLDFAPPAAALRSGRTDEFAQAPHPLDVTTAAPVLALARQRGLLGADEALVGETDAFARLLDRYEGHRQKLDEAVRGGTAGVEFARRGEAVVVDSAHLSRGEHGEPKHGRALLALDPTGGLTITRTPIGTMPGRLRKGRGTDT
jgi:hypothetical protein